jgi:hypothetical protein
VEFTDFIEFKLWKLAAFVVLAFAYGIWRGLTGR